MFKIKLVVLVIASQLIISCYSFQKEELLEFVKLNPPDLPGLGFFLDQYKYEIDINVVDNYGRTALFYLTSKVQDPTEADIHTSVLSLIDFGADPNIAEPATGRTPLMNAAYNGNENVINVLLARGARLNVQDVQGRTALDYAKLAGKNETVRKLKELGGKSKDELAEIDLLKRTGEQLVKLYTQLQNLKKILQ